MTLMTRADFESILPPKDNGKQTPDKSYTNEQKLFLDFLVRKKHLKRPQKLWVLPELLLHCIKFKWHAMLNMTKVELGQL